MSKDLFKLRQQPKAPPVKLTLTRREAAQALGVCERTIWQWTKQGRLPHIRMGKSVRYPVAALESWLDEQVRANQTPMGGQHETH